ncbi:MAG TPA: transglycosylase family protein, partial [Candidatus Saccharibacteria bacterium]|nr:transglycosylase family protein [Candidatus Saccharibacteria bacterium]
LQPQNQQMIVGSKTAAFGGDFAAALARLRSCEGAYTSNTGNGYYGAYQFNLGSWRANAPAGYENMLPSQAPSAVQDQAAATYYKKSGWRPWPSCSRSLGLLDIYR